MLFVALSVSAGVARAVDCANLPTHFTGNEFTTGDFFTNFQNPCYLIPLAPQGSSKTDLSDTYWQIFYKVDPHYQLIIVGSYPNARYFSLTANDDHYLLSQTILDADIVPLTSSYVNPYQPGVPYAAGQQYAVAMNFGGTPGNIETGCTTNGYNVDVNSIDATLRHQGINWNTNPGFFQILPTPPLHVVDTPQHSNPTKAGYLMVRAYLDINPTDSQTIPSVIVRDVASGCAYPAAYALQTLQIVTPNDGTSWLDHNQFLAHQTYEQNYLPALCYGTDPQNALSWARQGEVVKFPNPHSSYLTATVPPNLPATLAAAGEVMRMRWRLPTTPPTPCTNGCSRSGNEQMRYVGLSFYPNSGGALASLADSYFTRDANGYATLIVGTGASIPSWITPANGYTFLDLTQIVGYKNLSFLELRDILPAATFACGAQVVPFKTSVYTPDGNMIGDYLPEVDFPLAASLPQAATELVGPNSCGVLPAGVPAVAPACGVLPANPTTITSIPPPSPGESSVSVQPIPPITLSGEGFGFFPLGVPYTGNSNYLEVTNLSEGWSAGYTGNVCNITVDYWADDRVEIAANVNVNGVCPLAIGDQLVVSIWNPQTGNGPVTSTIAVSADPTYALGTSSVLVGSAAGNGTVALLTAGPWIASSNASWLHLSPASTSGVGSALIGFAYDANSSSDAQTGTLTIAGLTFTVTQAGVSYAPVVPMTPLITSGLSAPQGVAVDAQGNVYIADTGHSAIQMWNPGTRQLTTLISAGLINPVGVAVDTYGNIYVADTGNHAIEEWNAATQQMAPLVPGLASPYGVAVDAQGNVYFSDSANHVIEEWIEATGQVVPLVASGLTDPLGVAVDGIGNLYFADAGTNAVEQWSIGAQRSIASVSAGLNQPTGVALDGQDNVFFSDAGNNAIKHWNVASQQVITVVSSGLNNPAGVARDAQGNLYVADQNNNAIQKITPAYLCLTPASLNEGAQAGADAITAQVLPASTALTATSDQSWLTITNVAGGTISFAFEANTSDSSRTANITVLGQSVPVIQAGGGLGSLVKSAGDGQSAATGQLFATSLQVTVTDTNGLPVQGVAVTFTVTPGATGAAGTWNSNPPQPIVTDQNGNAVAPALTANNIGGAFTVTASAGGLSVTFNLTNVFYALATTSATVGSGSGSGSVLLLAGGPWTATSNAPWLSIAAGSQSGTGSAVIYYTYSANQNTAPQTGTLTISGMTFTVTQAAASYVQVYPIASLITSGLQGPGGLAVDQQNNVYIADTAHNAIREWVYGSRSLITLVSSGLSSPSAVAVDGQGNVYIADTSNNAIKEWNATTQQVSPLVQSGLNGPAGIAVDGQGNVYFSDTGHNVVKEWFAATGAVTTLIPSGLRAPAGIALDAFGNLFIADTQHNAVKVWSPITNLVSNVVIAGLKRPNAVDVDGGGNVYIADSGNNAIKLWNAATSQLTALATTGLSSPGGLAMDGLGNLYIADTNDNVVDRLTTAYVLLGATSVKEGPQAGTDSVSVQVFPAGAPITVTSSQSWLTITSQANGTVAYSFTANTSVSSRAAVIKICTLKITVSQAGDTVASITKIAGMGQVTLPGQLFAIALQVQVKDAAGNPIQGVPVTFNVVPGATGASGTFSSSPPMPIVTDSSGLATAPALTANSIAGVFTVSAKAGAVKAAFSLTIASQ